MQKGGQPPGRARPHPSELPAWSQPPSDACGHIQPQDSPWASRVATASLPTLGTAPPVSLPDRNPQALGGAGRRAALTPGSLLSAPPAPPPPKRAPTTALTLRSKSMTSELEELGKSPPPPLRAAPAPHGLAARLPPSQPPRWLVRPAVAAAGWGGYFGLFLLLVHLTVFCFEFLGLSLVDKGKRPQGVPQAAPPAGWGAPQPSMGLAQTSKLRPGA